MRFSPGCGCCTPPIICGSYSIPRVMNFEVLSVSGPDCSGVTETDGVVTYMNSGFAGQWDNGSWFFACGGGGSSFPGQKLQTPPVFAVNASATSVVISSSPFVVEGSFEIIDTSLPPADQLRCTIQWRWYEP